MLHFTGIICSGRAKAFSLSGDPGGCVSFHSGLSFGIGWMLWLVWSLVLMSRFCPAIKPTTWGEYMQPVWSMVTAVAGTAHCLSGSPAFTNTNAFFSVPFELTTTSSDFTALPWCALSQ